MKNPNIDGVRAARACIAPEGEYARTKIPEWACAEQAASKNKNPNKATTLTPAS